MITRLFFSLILVIAPIARSQQPQTVSVLDADAAPDTVLNRTLLLTGIMSVLKQDTTLLSSSGDTSLDAYVTFTSGWRARSPAKAVQLLDQLRRRSRTRFPHPGYTVIELDFKSAEVVLEGRLTNNPDFKQVSTPEDSKSRLLDPTLFDRRYTAKYRFEVTRIVRLKEHHWQRGRPTTRWTGVPTSRDVSHQAWSKVVGNKVVFSKGNPVYVNNPLNAPHSGWPTLLVFLKENGIDTSISLALDKHYMPYPDAESLILEMKTGSHHTIAHYIDSTVTIDGKKAFAICEKIQNEFDIQLACKL
jgi:hypothetical protein